MTFDLKSLTGKAYDSNPIIGAVQVNIPFEYRKSDYECAAWSEDHQAQVGVHPVYLGRSYHYPQLLTITAHIRAKVISDYFPGLWGGVPISREPYQTKHVGEERVIYRSISIEDAIQRTGNSPGYDAKGEMDWFIHPSWLKVFAEEALSELKEDYRRLPEFWREFESLDESTFTAKLDGRYGFDMEYRAKVGMVAHFGGLLEKWSRRLEKINWQAQYQPGGASDSAYQRENFTKNTEWAKVIPIQTNE